MPASVVAGGSIAPMENSPPEIQTIPCGGGAGCLVGLGIVGPKAAKASAIGWLASTLLAGERRDESNTATATVAKTTARAIRIQNERR